MLFSEFSRFFANAVTDRDVLLFRKSNEVDSPHLYICIKKTATDVLLLVMSTTQEARLKRHAANRGLNESTIVHIRPKSEDPSSPMSAPSWINCNDVYQYTVE